jgi:SAM-dependent methyltransferase
MSTILASERETYAQMWSAVEDYSAHAPGEQYLPLFLQVVGDDRGSVLDAGTGSGKGAVALYKEGFDVVACDVTDAGLVDEFKNPELAAIPFYPACLWDDLSFIGRPAYVYCTDVLEHIPPQFTMLAIYQMLQVARKGLFLTVSLVPDSFGVWAGKSLHQTVQPFTWWKDSLAEVGTVIEARDLISNAVFVVKPK